MLTHKHVYISTVILSESRKEGKTLRNCSEQFLHSAISFFPKHFKFTTLPKFQTMYLLGHVFVVRSPHCASKICH